MPEAKKTTATEVTTATPEERHVINIGYLSSEGINKISTALSKAQSEIKTVTKNKTGKVSGTAKKSGNYYEYSYKYADFEAVREAVRDVAAKHGLAIVMRPDQDSLHAILLHESGQWIDYGRYPLGVFEGHQVRGGAITYAKRYIESCIYDIATEEDDDANHADANTKPNVPPIVRQPAPPALKAYATKVPQPTATPSLDEQRSGASAFTNEQQRDQWFAGIGRNLDAALSLTDLEETKTTYKDRLNSIKNNGHPLENKMLNDLMQKFSDKWESLIPKAPQPQKVNVDSVMRNAAPLDAPKPPRPKDDGVPTHVLDDEIPF